MKMKLYQREFDPHRWPTYEEVAAMEAAGFVDESWHNNMSPSWAHDVDGRRGWNCVTIYADTIDPAHREIEGGPRFTVCAYVNGSPTDDEGRGFNNVTDAVEYATAAAADLFHTLFR